jgi:hypothetical protein
MRRLSRFELVGMLRDARKTNAQRDVADHRFGFSAPHECSPRALLATARMAIEAGLLTGDPSCVCEGLVMLEQLAERVGTAHEEKAS